MGIAEVLEAGNQEPCPTKEMDSILSPDQIVQLDLLTPKKILHFLVESDATTLNKGFSTKRSDHQGRSILCAYTARALDQTCRIVGVPHIRVVQIACLAHSQHWTVTFPR